MTPTMLYSRARHSALTMAAAGCVTWWPGQLGTSEGWQHTTRGTHLLDGQRDALTALNATGHITVAEPPAPPSKRRFDPRKVTVTDTGLALLRTWDRLAAEHDGQAQS